MRPTLKTVGELRASGHVQESLREEERMAAWVDKNVPEITAQFLEQQNKHAA